MSPPDRITLSRGGPLLGRLLQLVLERRFDALRREHGGEVGDFRVLRVIRANPFGLTELRKER